MGPKDDLSTEYGGVQRCNRFFLEISATLRLITARLITARQANHKIFDHFPRLPFLRVSISRVINFAEECEYPNGISTFEAWPCSMASPPQTCERCRLVNYE